MDYTINYILKYVLNYNPKMHFDDQDPRCIYLKQIYEKWPSEDTETKQMLKDTLIEFCYSECSE
jgi:hypothetical protein